MIGDLATLTVLAGCALISTILSAAWRHSRLRQLLRGHVQHWRLQVRADRREREAIRVFKRYRAVVVRPKAPR